MKTEVDLAERLVHYLRERNYEVYQEVPIYGNKIDIVAKKDDKHWAIECKMMFNLDVLGQAYNNREFVHYSSICVPNITKNRPYGVPNVSKSRSNIFGREAARKFGLGVIEINKSTLQVFETVQPIEHLNAKYLDKLALFEQQKDYVQAGSNSGKAWSSFQNTRKTLFDYIKSQGDSCKLIDAIKNIKHHYASDSSAVSALRKIIKHKDLDEFSIDSDGIVYITIPDNEENKNHE